MAHQQGAAQPNCLHAIPSIHETNGSVPLVPGNLDLNRSIQAGVPVDPQNLVDAKSVAMALQVVHYTDMDVRVTAAVAESAELRAAAVEAAHVFATYTPTNIVQALDNLAAQINQRIDASDLAADQRFHALDQRLIASDLAADQRFHALDQRLIALDHRFNLVDQRLDQAMALSRNNRIIAFNRHHATPQHYQPFYKTVPGDGVALATAIYGNVQNAQPQLVQPAQVPVVGTVPPNFNNNFSTYHRAHIIDLIIFYNESFGIVAGDTIAQCVAKFHVFLTTY